MTALEEARERKCTLWNRYKAARAAYLDARDPAERRKQKDRARVLNSMYREAVDEVNRLDPEFVPKKPPAPKPGTGVGGGFEVLLQSGALWADLEGETWSKLAGQTWDSAEKGSGRNAKVLCQMVVSALEKCTQKQRDYIKAYYADNTAMVDIAEDFGVHTSSVSRVIKNGLGRVERYVTAKLLLSKCVDSQGYFDYLLFVNSAQVLTERQKELVYLMLAQDTSYRDISGYTNRHPSTISRTAERVERNLEGIAVELDWKMSSVKIRRRDWEGRTEKELAEDLGLSPKFYYQMVRWGEKVGEIPILHYVILRRLRAGEAPEEVSDQLCCNISYVKDIGRRYAMTQIPDVEVEEYRPKPPRKVSLPENPFVMVSGDAIIDRIDGATYKMLRARFGGV